MQRGVTIDYDLEGTPLEIKTDSELGSNEYVFVYLYSAGGDKTGYVYLYFSSAMQYQLGYCTYTTNLPTAPPSTANKVWRITLTRSSGVRVQIHCNGVEVLNLLLSDRTCGYSSWSTTWNRDVEKIWFHSRWDTASDKYRPGK